MKNWSQIIFSDELSFEKKTKQVFEHQYKNNVIYRRYCEALNPKILKKVKNNISFAPLLPVKAFKDANVVTQANAESDLTFKSSGTTDMQRSVHYVANSSIYDQSIVQGFSQFYDLDNSVIWGYTPGYAENPHSSLIYMIQKLLEQDDSGLSRFLPLDEPLKRSEIEKVQENGKQLILFGAAFGLLDLLEMKDITLPSNSIVIETGGMKTHRREISKRELHNRLANGFELDQSRIHSEYGMAELLSQAYSTGGQWLKTVPWMKVSIRDPDNPHESLPAGKEGLIGVIDLANVHSCSFLLTGDEGVKDKRDRFKVLGRWDPQDLRGCNFLIEED